MDIFLHAEDLPPLVQRVLGEKARVQGVECGQDRMTIRLKAGFIPLSVEFADFRLDGTTLRVRVAGALASKLIGMVGHRVDRDTLRVDGDQLHLTLPPDMVGSIDVRHLEVTDQGVRVVGRLR